jgi:hypothetical protein
MIKVGQEKKAKYWGNFTVRKVARLNEPVVCHSKEKGKALFNPTLVQIAWETPPSDDMHEFWFPYWITIGGGKEKYGQFAPMIGENALMELLGEAIKQDFFSKGFLTSLRKAISSTLDS